MLLYIMTDLEIINSLSSEPERPVGHVSIEHIMNVIPCMEINNPSTYALYLYYNKEHLEDDEKNKINNLIEKLQNERSKMNKYNMDYLERDLSGVEKKPMDNINE